jgi:hypothetical protein
MLVFRFRVTFEDVEDVERIIDISAKNTFMDLHKAIQKSINFDNQKDVTFVKVNNAWRGDEKISNITKPGIKSAENSEIGKFINDPHQRFLYQYDADSKWILRIELIKLIKDDGKSEYPSLMRESGIAPKQYIHPADIVQDASARLYKEADDLLESLTSDLKFDKDDAYEGNEPDAKDLEDVEDLIDEEETQDDDNDSEDDDTEDDSNDEDMEGYDPEDTKGLNEMDNLW